MDLESIYSPIRGELDLVESQLRELSPSSNADVASAVSEILGAGGKRLRPALLLIAAKACNYSGARAVTLAVVVELIHVASLIHDDVIDEADVRRGVSTVNSRWGNRVAVLAGDHLYSKAVDILAKDGATDVVRTVTAAACSMTDSEVAQTLRRNALDVTEEDYLSIIAGKTAALMSCSCRVGAMLGEQHNGEVETLGEYGQNLGMAFQITDDLLDITGKRDLLGKPLGSDFRGGMLTLPYIHALNTGEECDREVITEAFRSDELGDTGFAEVRDALDKCGGIDYSFEKAREYVVASRKSLESLEDSESRTSLDRLAAGVVERVC